MKIGLTIILLFASLNCSMDLAGQNSSDLIGRWKIEVTFESQSKHSFNLDAGGDDKGSALAREAQSNWDEPAKPSQAKWTVGAEKQVTISAPMEFPIGNVGREQGVLVFKGSFKSENKITGDVSFFPTDQDPMDPKSIPTRTGKFEATRVNAQ